ncbi:MAG TPA: hypothetical protein VF113_03215 [Stellaceae bacterium]
MSIGEAGTSGSPATSENHPAMKHSATIEIGQRFRSIGVTGKPTGAYEVQALFRSQVDRLDYARIVDLSDSSHTKVFAIAALANPRHFLPMPPSAD